MYKWPKLSSKYDFSEFTCPNFDRFLPLVLVISSCLVLNIYNLQSKLEVS